MSGSRDLYPLPPLESTINKQHRLHQLPNNQLTLHKKKRGTQGIQNREALKAEALPTFKVNIDPILTGNTRGDRFSACARMLSGTDLVSDSFSSKGSRGSYKVNHRLKHLGLSTVSGCSQHCLVSRSSPAEHLTWTYAGRKTNSQLLIT